MPTDRRRVVTEYSIDASKAVKGLRDIARASNRTADSVGRMERDFQKVSRNTNNIATSFDKLNRGLGTLNKGFTAIAGVVAVDQILEFGAAIIRAADSVELLTLQMEGLGGGAEGFDNLYEAAQRLGVPLQTLGQTLNFLVPGLSRLGIGFGDSVGFAEDLTRSMRLFGVQAQQSNAILLQLGQALSSGVFSGDELKSFRENAAGLSIEFEKAVQSILGVDDSLKDLGEAQVLTSEVTQQAFSQVFESLRERFDELPETLEQQEARFGNAAIKLFSSIDEQLRISEFWGFLTGGAADLMEDLADQISGIDPFAGLSDSLGGDVQRDIIETEQAIERLTNELDGLYQYQESSPLQVDEELLDYISRLEADLGRARERLVDFNNEQALVEGAAADAAVAAEGVADAIDKVGDSANDSSTKLGKFGASLATYAENADFAEKSLAAFTKGGQAELDLLTRANNLREIYNKTLQEGVQVGLSEADATVKAAEAMNNANRALEANQQLQEARSRVQDKVNTSLDRGIGTYREILKLTDAQTDKLNELLPLFERWGEQFGVPTELLVAVSKQESNFNNLATSVAGAQGAMQFMDATAKGVAQQLRDLGYATVTQQSIQTEFNDAILAGAKHLSDLYERFGSWTDALIAYNAGPGRVGLPFEKLPRETRDYVNKILPQAVALTEQLGSSHQAAMRIMETSTPRAVEEVDNLGEAISDTDVALQDFAYDIQSGLGRAFEDLFSGAIDSTKDFVRSLRDIILNAVSRLAAQLLQTNIIIPITAALTGTAQAGVPGIGGGGGGLGGLGNIGRSITNVFSSEAFSIGETIGSGFERFLFNTPLSDLGTSISNAASQISNFQFALSGGIGAIGGGLLGGMLFDGQAAKLGASIGSSAGAVLGTALTPLLGPLGPLAGGLLGGLGGGGLGSLFGGQGTEPFARFAVTQGEIRGAGGAKIDEALYREMEAYIGRINDSTRILGEMLGEEAEAARKGFEAFSSRMDPEQIESYLQGQSAAIIESMLEAVPGAFGDMVRDITEGMSGDLEGLLTGLNALMMQLQAFGEVVEYLDPTAFESYKDAAEVFAQLGERAPEVTANLANLAALFESATAEEEKLAIATQEARDAFADVGMVMPGSLAALEEWSKQLDLTTTDGLLAAEVAGSVAEQLKLIYDNGQLADTSIGSFYQSLVATVPAVDNMVQKTAEMQALFEEMNSTLPNSREQLLEWINAGKFTEEQLQRMTDAAIDLGLVLDEAAQNSATTEELLRFITPAEVQRQVALDALTLSLEAVNLQLPKTTDELYQLYLAGELTEEQLAVLARNLDTLRDVVRDTNRAIERPAPTPIRQPTRIAPVEEPVDPLVEFLESLRDTTRDGAADFESLLAQFEKWQIQMPESRDALLEMYSAGEITEAQMRQLADSQDLFNSGMDYYGELLATTTIGVDTAGESVRYLNTELEDMAEYINDLQPGVIQNIGDLAQRLAQLGITDLPEANSNLFEFTQLFEQFANVTPDATEATRLINEAFSELGILMPESVDQFSALLQGIDLSTDAGLQMALMLGGLSEEIAVWAEELLKGSNSLQEYTDALKSVNDTLAATRQDIFEFGLSPEQIYQLRKEEADRLASELATLTDPAEIANAVDRINTLIIDGWGVLDDRQKSALREPFLQYLDELAVLAEERLQLGIGEIAPTTPSDSQEALVDFATMMQGLTQDQTVSSEQLVSASDTMADSVNLFTTAVVNFSQKVDEMPTEVEATTQQANIR